MYFCIPLARTPCIYKRPLIADFCHTTKNQTTRRNNIHGLNAICTLYPSVPGLKPCIEQERYGFYSKSAHIKQATVPTFNTYTRDDVYLKKTNRFRLNYVWKVSFLTGFDFGYYLNTSIQTLRRSQWPRGLRRRSAATRLMGLWVRTPPGA